jgi:hypothetical protein
MRLTLLSPARRLIARPQLAVRLQQAEQPELTAAPQQRTQKTTACEKWMHVRVRFQMFRREECDS